MKPWPEPGEPPFTRRREDIRRAFDNLADYLWKLPSFLDAEREIEQEKLLAYYPESDDPEIEARNAAHREWRARHEFDKIDIAFSSYMASSALITVVSNFEYQLLRIAAELKELGLWREPRRSQGLSAHLAGIATAAGDRWPPRGYPQMRSAIIFRNCLAHAGGVVWMSRDMEEIRRIVKTREFYPKALRDKSPEFHLKNDPRLGFSPVGQVLFVPMPYTHWLSAWTRDCLLEICEAVDPILTLPLALPEGR